MAKQRTIFTDVSRTGRLAGGIGGTCEELRAILHVDDDPNDIELFRAAVCRSGAALNVRNVADGEDAIAYLAGANAYSDRARFPLPALVLLDLKLPRANGFEVLRWIRGNPATRQLPVLVLSGSELGTDIERAYANGATSYIVKPLGFEALVSLIREFAAEWLGNSRANVGYSKAVSSITRSLGPV